jgi:hypothetical protein
MTLRTGWRDDAACRDADADLFFPVGTMGPALRQIDEAKRICPACPAQAACLAWAVDHAVRPHRQSEAWLSAGYRVTPAPAGRHHIAEVVPP